MKPFIPAGYADLRDAITRLAQHWFKAEMDVVSLSQDERTFIIDRKTLHLNKNPTIRQKNTRTPEGNERAKALIARLHRKEKLLQATWDKLITHLYNSELLIYVIDERGIPCEVPPIYWGTRAGRGSFNPSPFSRAQPWYISFESQQGAAVSGAPLVLVSDLVQFLEGKTLLSTKAHGEVAPSPRTDKNTTGGTAQAPASQRNRPGRDRVQVVLRQMYPTGIPSSLELTDQELVHAVGKRMLDRMPSKDTVLRAAGRRK